MQEHPLARISLFEKLSPEELVRLDTIVKRKMYGPNTIVFKQDDHSDSMYVILSGSTKVYTETQDGTPKILNTLGKGEIFGEYSLIDGHPRSATIETLEPTEMLSISHKDFRQFVTNSPDVLWKVLESLTERMRRGNEEQLAIAFRDVPYRLLRTLSRLVDKHGETTAEGTRIKVKLTPEALSGMVTAQADRVSRILHRFNAEGLIRSTDDGTVIIPDVTALKRSVEFVKDWS